MNALDTKRLVNGAALCLLAVIAVGVVLLFVKRQTPIGTTPPQSNSNFSRLICDNAYQSEKHYEKLNPPYIDVKLTEGCFSGFVGLPDRWNTWQVQFRGNDGSDWMGEWYGGWPNPAGPFSQATVNGMGLPKGTVPSKQIRFEGKGTLRLYRLTGDMRSTPPGGTDAAEIASTPSSPAKLIAPAKDPDPILPMSASKDYSLVLEECTRSAEKVDCWGYMTSKNDAPAESYFHIFEATDDEGNVFRGSIALEGPRLAPGVKTRWNASFPEAHANAHSASLRFRVHFGVHGEFADNDELIFNNIPFEQKKAPTE